ncbi:Uncharacterised protein [Mycobacteroides abscessus subsp. abscessus]|nr:Uncharacterised protein [Mycobacteroides abscessus subsp. abscessus]
MRLRFEDAPQPIDGLTGEPMSRRPDRPWPSLGQFGRKRFEDCVGHRVLIPKSEIEHGHCSTRICQ